MTRQLIRGVFWGLMTLMCVGFVPMAAEFYFVTVSESTATYAKVLGLVVSEEYAFGPASGFAEMTPYWRSMPSLNQMILGVHAALASIALLVGPIQFMPGLRARYPRLHRWAGRLYFCAGIPSIVLSMVYLLLTPMDKIYGGPPFAIGLWGIAVLTLYTFVAGLVQVLRGEIDAHRATMVLNFSALLIAPLLRVWWALLGWIFLDQTFNGQDQSHTAVLMFLGLETVVGAILVMHVFGKQPAAHAATPALLRLRRWALDRVPATSLVLLALGFVVSMTLINQSWVRFGAGPDLFGSFRDTDFLFREHIVFMHHTWAFIAHALGVSLLLMSGPVRIRQLFLQGRASHARIVEALFTLGWLLACAGWVGLALGFGMDGISGWGSSVYWLALATGMMVFGGVRTHSVWTCQARQVREFTLHMYALALTPLTFGFLQWCFLANQFSWDDAFLSAGVLATSVNLSFSYYYTGYGCRAFVSDRENSLASAA